MQVGIMRLMGLQAIYQAPRTSDPHPEHRIYPYLLRNLEIKRPNHVWCADITYIPVQRGFLYLVAIMDWATRHVLAWQLSNTMDAKFCVEALNEALSKYGKPEIFNTDQGREARGLCPRFVLAGGTPASPGALPSHFVCGGPPRFVVGRSAGQVRLPMSVCV